MPHTPGDRCHTGPRFCSIASIADPRPQGSFRLLLTRLLNINLLDASGQERDKLVRRMPHFGDQQRLMNLPH
ncbi:MAG: hypothetical protein V2J42_15375, partial [Wenzhouxiangella sp.]|nr:hypothetical protein [Wenzhouxiangella sp.]